MARLRRKKWIVIGIICFVLLAAALAVILQMVRSSGIHDAAFINGEPVDEREFQMELQDQKAAVLQYFNDKYGTEVNVKGFWTTPVDVEIPIELAKTKAMKEMVGIKVQQVLMKNEGIVNNISYTHFLSLLTDENARRKAAVAAGKPIYGPQVYTAKDYYQYLFSTQVIDLKKKLSSQKWNATDQQLMDDYNSLRDKNYKIADDVTTQQLTIDYGGGVAENLGDKTNEVKSALSKLEQDAKTAPNPSSGDWMDQVEAYAKNAGWKVQSNEQVYTGQDMQDLSDESSDLAEAISSLKPGEISQPIFFGGSAHIIKVLERKSMGYLSFNEVKDDVRDKYIDEQYTAYVAGLEGQAKVVLNHKIYDHLQMQ